MTKGEIINWIRSTTKQLGVSHDEMASRMGISVRQYRRYRSDMRALDFGKLSSIVSALGYVLHAEYTVMQPIRKLAAEEQRATQ